MNQKLAIFDIDGTLCDTYDVDAECFMKTAVDLLGSEVNQYDWQLSPHVTDSGIVNWLWQKIKGFSPTQPDLDSFRQKFMSALVVELDQAPARFKEIPGAKDIMSTLQRFGWNVAIGTGGWRSTAQMKLDAIGMPKNLLCSTSDDSYDRVEIFRLAWRCSAEKHRMEYNRVVLVGDGTWDVKVASQLRWPFLGIGNGNKSKRLVELGASSILNDYLDHDRVMKALETCKIPANKS